MTADDDQLAMACRLAGKARYSLRDLQGSEAAYRQAVDLDRGRAEAYRGLAELHASLGQDGLLCEDYRALVRCTAC